jgi:hypothetical protein
MSDEQRLRTANPRGETLVAGVASGILYSSAVFAFAFLIPVQLIYGRQGKKSGLAAAGISFAFALIGQMGRDLLATQRADWAGLFGLAPILALVLPPFILLALLALMNLSFWDTKRSLTRGLAATALGSAFLVPALVALERDMPFRGFLEERLATVSKTFLSGTGEGYEASALKAALDPHALAAATFQVLNASFAACLFVFLAGSWWIGNRASGADSEGRKIAKGLDELRLPYAFVWPFLAAWAALLCATYFKLGELASAAAWNIALVLSLSYAAQGLGLISFLLKRWNTPRSLKVCLAVMAVVTFATPPIGTALLAILPILGVTEIWIPYRKPKGVGA